MNYELTKGNITEINCRPNIAYLLNEPAIFSSTGYKFLQTQEEYFVPCKGLMYNGKKELVFFTENYKCLSDIMPALDNKNILSMLAVLVKTIIDIKNIGFLSCNNIALSLDKIFWDIKEKTIKLVYLPINGSNSASRDYEDTLKKLIIETVETRTSLSTSNTTEFREVVLDSIVTLEDLYRKLYEGHKSLAEFNNVQNDEVEPEDIVQEKIIETETPELFLVNVADGKKIHINKNDFIIGKSINADGVIKDNKAVSRTHWMIFEENGCYSIVDLESANGTYLNGSKLTSGEEYAINNGDKIRIANSNWVVEL